MEKISFNLDIYGLLYDCPYKKRENNCCFRSVENLDFYNRIKWFESLTDNEKKVLGDNHALCSYNRNSKLKFSWFDYH